jgi:phenylpropionate dioxygenase-like ring-hydroxylating dioxygenase large terminal subunit
MYPCSEEEASEEVNTICRLFNFANNPSYLLTERAFDAPYSYYLQIENLLDPAHINFVHDGFQGDKNNAGEIRLDHIEVNGTFMSATFSHPGQNIPRVQITFWMPYVVEVSVYNGDDIVRKNIIYVIPTADNCCRVLFRDVVVTKHISPQEPFSKALVQLIANTDSYKTINANIVEDIFNQDLLVLQGQQANVGSSYHTSQYVLPTESDRLIVEFRKWARR